MKEQTAEWVLPENDCEPSRLEDSTSAVSLNILRSPHSPSENIFEKGVRNIFKFAAYLTFLVSAAIFLIFAVELPSFFAEVSWKEVFLSTNWQPLIDPRNFGIWPLVLGTFKIAVGALLIAAPIGIFISLLLFLYTPKWLRTSIKSILELFASIPSIVLGFVALSFITPALKEIFPSLNIFNALSASIVVGLLALPLITSLCDDALQSLPKSWSDAASGLGVKKYKIGFGLLLPAALPGILSASLLAFSRAIGETMAVTLAAGSMASFNLSYLEGLQTMTAFIVQVSMGDVPHGSIEFKTIFLVGALLFGLTAFINTLALKLKKKLEWE